MARAGLEDDVIHRFDWYLHDSITYGLDHFDDALDYAMRYGRGKSRDLIAKFVSMYVNDRTVDMDSSGEESIRRMFEMARKQDLAPGFELKFAPEL